VFIALIQVPLHIFSFRSFALMPAPASTEKHTGPFRNLQEKDADSIIPAPVTSLQSSTGGMSRVAHSVKSATRQTVLRREDNPYLQLKGMEPMSGVEPLTY
jgi:hypothetical protein